jgi:N-acetylmuramoyl-L-alanine amidase
VPRVIRVRWVVPAVAMLLAAWWMAAIPPPGMPVTAPPLAGNLLRGRTIVLDPGHGGYDPGALGRMSREADINLAIALKLRMWLQLAGARVLMTWSRPGEIPPDRKYKVRERAAWIAATHANLLIDIHCNSGQSAWGPQVFYWDGAPSRLLADYVSDELHYFTKSRRAVTRIDQYVLRHAGMPAINVEVGFINNSREEQKLLDPAYQRALAWYIFIGIERWYLRGRWPLRLLESPPPTDLLAR